MRFAWVVRSLSATLLAAIVPSSQAAVVANPTINSEISPALEIARAAYPKEALPAFRANFATEFAKGFRTSPQAQRMEKLFPGFTNRFAQQAVGEIRRIATARMPLLHAKLATIISAEFTVEQQQQLLGFYKSPAGQAVVSSVAQNIDIQSLAKATVTDGVLTAEERERQLTIAGMGAMLAISDAHKPAIEAFMDSPLGVKLIEIETTRVPAAISEWQAETPAEDIRRIDAIALRVAEDMARK